MDSFRLELGDEPFCAYAIEGASDVAAVDDMVFASVESTQPLEREYRECIACAPLFSVCKLMCSENVEEC